MWYVCRAIKYSQCANIAKKYVVGKMLQHKMLVVGINGEFLKISCFYTPPYVFTAKNIIFALHLLALKKI